jgi:hypothetical protein
LAITCSVSQGHAAITENDACLVHLKAVTCISDNREGGFDRNCSFKKVTPEILAQIPNLIKLLPSIHKKVFCNLNRLQIQPHLSSIGYAAFLPGKNNEIIGDMIGLQAGALAGHTPYDLWSWKEQLNFGLSDPYDKTYSLSDQGPLIRERISGVKTPLLLHAMIHEITHLLHVLNSFDWAAESAEDSQWLSQLCYYDCRNHIQLENMKDVYEAMGQSDFVTPYATQSNMEDFAETSTIFFLDKMNFEFKIFGPDKSVLFDYRKVWQHPRMLPKKKQLIEFYSRKNLIYKVEPVTTADTGH